MNYPVLCGSSAIAEELPKFLSVNSTTHPVETIDVADDNGVLVVSGSLTPQTRDQTAYLVSSGVETLVLNTRTLFNKSKKQQEINSITDKAKHLIAEGKDLLVLADNNEEHVIETKETGVKLGLDDPAISKLVSASLAEITKQVVDDTGLKRLIIAGGDTSGTICRTLGIKGNHVLQEIETGLPSGLAIGREMLIVLKSGSFGGQDFLGKAILHLKKLSNVEK
ncbi:nucleotide-binding domain containing protein [Lentibacillus sp. N15]|uniref:nucleotide-binding domain containing protein n=1 Tax=Lentibacillus songyuanensis TaxID=3136161 RepID=UPI0031BA0D03